MNAETIEHMFRFTYTKPASQIISKAKIKRKALAAKIAERKVRIEALRKEYEIDDKALIDLLQAARQAQRSSAAMSYTYSVSNTSVGAGRRGGRGSGISKSLSEQRTVGAGVVNNLLTENDFIAAEEEQVKSLDLMIRNLKPIPQWSANGQKLPDREFTLSVDELVYLGF